MDVLLFLLLLIMCTLLIYLSYRFFDKEGLYYLLTLMIITSFSLSFKIVNILGFDFNCNVITTVTIFSILYILLEKNKKKENKKILEISIISIIISIIMILILNLYIPSVNDIVSVDIKNIFLTNYKILIIYPIILLGSEISIIYIYNVLKKEAYNSIFVISSIVCLSLGFIFCILFNSIGYLFALSLKDIIRLILMNYLVMILINIIYSFVIKRVLRLKKVNYE